MSVLSCLPQTRCAILDPAVFRMVGCNWRASSNGSTLSGSRRGLCLPQQEATSLGKLLEGAATAITFWVDYTLVEIDFGKRFNNTILAAATPPQVCSLVLAQEIWPREASPRHQPFGHWLVLQPGRQGQPCNRSSSQPSTAHRRERLTSQQKYHQQHASPTPFLAQDPPKRPQTPHNNQPTS